MYFGEPSSIPVWVLTSDERMRAMPKSMIFAGPPRTTMMLAGFTSRWTTPRLCAYASPSAIWAPMSRAACGSTRWLASRLFSSLPATNSIAM